MEIRRFYRHELPPYTKIPESAAGAFVAMGKVNGKSAGCLVPASSKFLEAWSEDEEIQAVVQRACENEFAKLAEDTSSDLDEVGA